MISPAVSNRPTANGANALAFQSSTRLTQGREDAVTNPCMVRAGASATQWVIPHNIIVNPARLISQLVRRVSRIRQGRGLRSPSSLRRGRAIVLAIMAAITLASPAHAGISTKCLPPQIKRVISHLEKFGRVEIVSAYRKNAVIAGTHKRSKHASCRAVDFHMRGNKAGAANWLSKQPVEWIRYRKTHTHWHVAVGKWKGWKR